MARKHAQYGPRRAVNGPGRRRARRDGGARPAGARRDPTTGWRPLGVDAVAWRRARPRPRRSRPTRLGPHHGAPARAARRGRLPGPSAGPRREHVRLDRRRRAPAEILDRFAGVGGNLVDTADSYAAGRSETDHRPVDGDPQRARPVRVITKVGRHPDRRGLAPESIAAAVDESLARLGTDRIDLLCFHGDDPDVPLEESLGAVDALITAARCSRSAYPTSPERLIEARVLAANGLPAFPGAHDALQPHGTPRLRGRARARGARAGPRGAAVLRARERLPRRHRATSSRHPPRRAGRAAGPHLGRRGLRVLRVLDEVAAAHDTVPPRSRSPGAPARPTVAAPVASASRPRAGRRAGRGGEPRAAPLGDRRTRPRVGLSKQAGQAAAGGPSVFADADPRRRWHGLWIA